MPFRESAVEERISMFRDWDSGAFTVEEVSRRYGISRETFYQWKRRRESGAEDWYEEISRAPCRCPHATPVGITAAVIAMRRRFPRFGPKKILGKLLADRPQMTWPAPSTIGDILKREGLILSRPRRRRPLAQGALVAGSDRANGEWSIDFKGWFRTLDGTRCDPLTIEDTASRYLIGARITDPNWAGTRCVLERVFKENGLPDAIRTDNGAPFGTTGAGGLSSLSVWWLRLGIEPRYIPPSSPQDNGRHERMHRTLKAETSKPPAATLSEQQARFDRFRVYYNEERPHEALSQTPPAKHWRPSPRAYPKRLEDPWYDADHEVRRVRYAGQIKWRNEYVFIGEALIGELVGIAGLDNGLHIVRFCGRDLGVINRDLRFHRFAPPRARLRSAMETQTGTE
jgi:transposase InsO family protein